MSRYCDYIKDDLYYELKDILTHSRYPRKVSDILEVLTDVIKDIEKEKENEWFFYAIKVALIEIVLDIAI